MTLLLLFAGGMTNGVEATKVTYHILTRPFSTKQRPYKTGVSDPNHLQVDPTADLVDYRTNIRVEALRVVVDNATEIGLPEYYKSPIAKNFRYYAADKVNVSENAEEIYGYNDSKYYIYTIKSDVVSDNEDKNLALSSTHLLNSTPTAFPASEDDDYVHIYVTYEYDAEEAASLGIDLSGEKEFNIQMGDRFLCLNKSRNNRPGGVNKSKVGMTDLASDDFCTITDGIVDGGRKFNSFHFMFRFKGEDPYNITIESSYDRSDTFEENDKNLGKKVFKFIKGSSLYSQVKSDGTVSNNMWLSSDDDMQWQTGGSARNAKSVEVPGYYKGTNDNKSVHSEMSPIFNSMALLRHANNVSGTYALAGTKLNVSGREGTVKQPNTSGLDGYLKAAGDNNIRMFFMEAMDADAIKIWPVRKYTMKVTTPFYNPSGTDEEKEKHTVSAIVKWSDYAVDVEPDTPIAASDSLKRKYCTFTKFYKEAAHTNEVTTYKQAKESYLTEIYADYTVAGLPFKTLAPADTTWYELTDAGSDQSSGKKIKYDGANFKNNGSDYEKTSEFAFIGDPFELQIISRSATWANASGMTYVKGASGTNLVVDNAVDDDCLWEIEYDNTGGSFLLRKYKSLKQTPYYWQWNAGSSGSTVACATTSTRVKTMILPKISYTYKIVDLSGRIAVTASEEQTLFAPPTIPAIIYSPFLVGETVTFHQVVSYSESTGRSAFTVANEIKETPGTENHTIYVKYTTNALSAKGYTLSQDQQFNVQLNGQYIYWDSGTRTIKSASTPGVGNEYLWRLRNRDPYAMLIDNVGASEELGTEDIIEYYPAGDGTSHEVKDRARGAYVKLYGDYGDYGDLPTTDVGTALAFDATSSSRTNAQRFVAKSSSLANVYEVMVATGDGVDASTNYYHIGLKGQDVIKVYANTVYEHDYAQLAFILTQSTAKEVTYHLIDLDGKELLTSKGRHEKTDQPQLPMEYWSPLVGDNYSYYLYGDFTIDGGVYTLNGSATPLSKVGNETDIYEHIYVTYPPCTSVDLSKGQMYLLKYSLGDLFRQETGGDNLWPAISDFTGTDAEKIARYQAVYPYCNGDCNFFVYGEEQFDMQQQGAASSRTRWAWFLESDKNDPYHVRICSRQTETFNNDERRGYFHTYKPDDYSAVITTLSWPGISGADVSEYMMVGTPGLYRLVTTEPVKADLNDDGDFDDVGENVRHTVKSFEQYWKTFDVVRKQMLGESDAKANSSDPNTVPNADIVGTTPDESTYRTTLTSTFGLHSYVQWAYAKRWNGYNSEGKTSKGWEEIEHWYQTVNMGEGYFQLVKFDIDPALILLDQHGWEVMRKPMPKSQMDGHYNEKLHAIRQYDSPMVQEYMFWGSAKKRTGFHQYYQIEKRIAGNYTATSLADHPSFDASNARDAKGNIYDQYVTYTVKDEYLKSYSVDYTTENGKITAVTATAQPFLIQQGGHFVSALDATTLKNDNAVPTGGMPQYIIENSSDLTPSGAKSNMLWYVKPNLDIDGEMGYNNPAMATVIRGWTNDYNDVTKVKASGLNSWAFDPYNIQISSVAYPEKYLVINATGASLVEGAMNATYGETPVVSLGEKGDVAAVWHDKLSLSMTNATMMAVQDANGNMQLMPRFDNARRVTDFTGLQLPQTNPANDQTGTQSTLLFRPLVYNYRIIDNDGHESLRYKSGGDLVPQTPDHFKSPMAKNFTYYKGYTYNSEKELYNGSGRTEITASLSGAGLTASGGGDDVNVVYVRYEYNEDADPYQILRGKWMTMKLNGKYVKYTTAVFADADTPEKPEVIDGSGPARLWQWKLLKTPQTNPDPYAVQLYNRVQKGKPISASTSLPAEANSQTEGASDTYQRFALLSHADNDGYALAVAGTRSNTDYPFLQGVGTNGAAMSAGNAASVRTETGFKSASCSFDETRSQVKFTDEVVHTFMYKVYTNGSNGSNEVKYGTLAIEAEQTNSDIVNNAYDPELPEVARTRLLNLDQYLYYENETDMGNPEKETETLYGFYDDVVYVRYKPYDIHRSNYLVPNAKTTVDSHVAKAATSHDAPIDIEDELLYNIYWYDDNIMWHNGSGQIGYSMGQPLQSDNNYIWKFDGGDPYAIRIKNMSNNLYAVGTPTLTATPTTTYMLLDKDGYDYGVLATTGDKSKMLSGYGQELSATPKQFVIFALGTLKVEYHLVIAAIGSKENVPYREGKAGDYTESDRWTDGQIKQIDGSTYRNLASYSFVDEDYGPVSLGDSLYVPEVMKRPNCVYTFYVGDITNSSGVSENDLINKYKGLVTTHMFKDPALIDKVVKVNIVYGFDKGLDTNNGLDFVKSTSQNLWYTFEALDNSGNPYLAQFTKAWGLKTYLGRDTRFTNDYLWTPVGDAYGFKMYNRYMVKNSGDETSVMNTATGAEGNTLEVRDDSEHSVYELLTSPTPGYFYVHPVVNTGAGTQLYVNMNNAESVNLQTTPSPWTFGLSTDLLRPYFDRVGYVGGLKQSVYDANTALATAIKNGTATINQVMAAQELVYNDDNLVKFVNGGYYRFHSQPGVAGVDPVRYLSGYTHQAEVTSAIPLHFYEKKGSSTTFENLKNGFTSSDATRGEIAIPAVEYDPSSIFQVNENGDATKYSGYKLLRMHTTETLYVGVDDGTDKDQRAVMKEGDGNAQDFVFMDIGGAVFLIFEDILPADRKYLTFDQTQMIYDAKFYHDTPTDDAKWCIEPANLQGLRVETHSGGDGYYYTTFCAPFDVTLTNKDKDNHFLDTAYVCTYWNTEVVHPIRMGQDIPKGTPVIIRTTSTTGYIPMEIPSSSLSPYTYESGANVFSGEYLEQLLDKDGDTEVYTFGLPFESGHLHKDAGYDGDGERSGVVVAELPKQENSGLGFYLNATPNKELGSSRGTWLRNNRYVLHNKIYYREGWRGVPATKPDPARELSDEDARDLAAEGRVTFIPVVFGDEASDESEGQQLYQSHGDDCVYDLSGRKVATSEQVRNTAWRSRLAPGIYLINGRKFLVK
jgi:hypothetical protein